MLAQSVVAVENYFSPARFFSRTEEKERERERERASIYFRLSSAREEDTNDSDVFSVRIYKSTNNNSWNYDKIRLKEKKKENFYHFCRETEKLRD